MAFASSQGLGSIFFATSKDSMKYFNLLNNPCVSILINDSNNLPSDIKNASAVSAEAVAKTAEKNKEKLKELLTKKHPELGGFLNEPDCELFELEIKNYFYVDNFNNKQVLKIK